MNETKADYCLQFSQHQQFWNSAQITPGQYPKTSGGGTWTLVAANDMTNWVQGFFPGLLWIVFERGRDAAWRTRADNWTRPLEVQKTNTQTHDLGFKFMCSYGNAYRLTGDTSYRDVLITAANSLATRYRPVSGIIDCCDWNSSWHDPMVTDTMMNLELLFWASRENNQPAWNDMALSHALKTLNDMVRPDGSTFHVVDYDSSTGAIISRKTYQGESDSSTWARGQAWAIHGFTIAYRYTRDARMLQAAQRVTDYYLNRLPADAVPNWDFDSPSQEKDSSAAAITASGLLELSTFVTDPTVAQRYRSAAEAMLDSLCSPDYLVMGTNNSPGVLKRGVGFYKKNEAVNATLIYGDYYFSQALYRYKLLVAGGWYSSLGFPGSLHNLGTGNTGVRTVEFDVTPLSNPIDAVIGYADTSTNVTAYSSLAMALRMNPSGSFDVRRGANYEALVQVPYTAHKTYHVRMRADLNARNYSVWIRPPGGSEVQIANAYAFRSDAPTTDDLGKVALKAGHFEYEFRVQNHTVTAG